MKVLIATDGSSEATAAVRTAGRLLRKEENEFLILCVAPEFSGRKADEASSHARSTYEQRLIRETESILNRAQRILAEQGINASTAARFGSPAKTILELSAGFDVTVVGATGKRDISKVGIGPVATRVLEHGSSMILVARDLIGENTWRVLLAVDGSRSSMQALRTMIDYCNASSLDVTCMHVVETPWVHFAGAEELFDVHDDNFPELQFNQQMEREADSILEHAEEELADYVLGHNRVIGNGNPGTAILGEAEIGDYDLIVLGSTGMSGLKHQMLGSVSAKVAAQAPCSVAVVKS
ncbi:MAG TPA: universal stress protein [Pyrinomonadaceae bacterium]|nr:universal stress protein [Pyrinomonadaceae bacterium]